MHSGVLGVEFGVYVVYLECIWSIRGSVYTYIIEYSGIYIDKCVLLVQHSMIV